MSDIVIDSSLSLSDVGSLKLVSREVSPTFQFPLSIIIYIVIIIITIALIISLINMHMEK